MRLNLSIILILNILFSRIALAGSAQIPFYADPVWQLAILSVFIIIFLISSKKIKTIMFGIALALGMVYLLLRLIQAWQGL